MSLAADLEIGDARIEFVADYVLKTLRIKPDKWTKMYGIEENKQLCVEFFDKSDAQSLILAVNASGGLVVSNDWPTQFKQKAVSTEKVHDASAWLFKRNSYMLFIYSTNIISSCF
jgi:hypothetical protein